MKWDKLVELGRELPEVREETWWRTPALKVAGKGFVRLKEDGESVLFFVENLDEKEALLATQPELYFTTDHYNGHASVLARLGKLRVGEARVRLERAWLAVAPAKVQRARGRGQGA